MVLQWQRVVVINFGAKTQRLSTLRWSNIWWSQHLRRKDDLDENSMHTWISLCLHMEEEEKIDFKFLCKQKHKWSQAYAKDSYKKGLKTRAIDSWMNRDVNSLLGGGFCWWCGNTFIYHRKRQMHAKTWLHKRVSFTRPVLGAARLHVRYALFAW